MLRTRSLQPPAHVQTVSCRRRHHCCHRRLRSSCSPDLEAPSAQSLGGNRGATLTLPPLLCCVTLCCRLRRLRPGDQAGSVPAGSGEAVARHLLQVPSVWLHPDRRVHQQVGKLEICLLSYTAELRIQSETPLGLCV